MKDRSCS